MSTDVTTRFPFINLEKALNRAEMLFAADRAARPMQLTTAFEVWGYSPKSSGGFQTVGALRGYGLLDSDGSSETKTVRLSSKAKHYFLDERDDQRKTLLSTFALMPPLFRSLWEDSEWQLGIPADPIARSHLKIERRLNEQSSRSLLNIFRDNVQFAGLQADEPLEVSLNDDDLDDDEDTPEITSISSSRLHPVHTLSARNMMAGGTLRATSGIIANTISSRDLNVKPAARKPIVFDMETVSGQYQFDNADDLREFIEKLEKLISLLPRKSDTV